MHTIDIAAAALLIEAAFGYPAPLFRAVSHPVVWIGTLLAALESRLNHPAASRVTGALALAALLLPVAAATILLATALPPGWPRTLASAAAASTLLAQRSLGQHVADVATALRHGLPQGRAAVARIVGRDPERLDAPAVARAAIESLAENFADGVVAPALWCALLGLPGIASYKAINTADSMIGHHTPRYEHFGWAAARLDDLVNLPASRLAALWIMAAAAITPGADAARAWRAVRRDARHHRSPNAGWPEAAMAGAIGLRLAGPRIYDGTTVDDAWMGDGEPHATAGDIDRALALYRRACALQIAAAVLLAAFTLA